MLDELHSFAVAGVSDESDYVGWREFDMGCVEIQRRIKGGEIYGDFVLFVEGRFELLYRGANRPAGTEEGVVSRVGREGQFGLEAVKAVSTRIKGTGHIVFRHVESPY